MLLDFLRRAFRRIHQVLVQNRRRERLAECLGHTLGSEALQLLDVGCGSGEVAECLQRRLPLAEVRGVDVLVRPHTRIPVEAFDGKKLPFPDDSFDYCLLVDVLHHTERPQELLRECLRVARRGIVVKDHLCDSRWDRARLRLMDFVGNWGHGVVLPYNYLSREQWRRLGADLRFSAVHWQEQLRLYPAPFAGLFDSGLHFVACFEPCR
ncbi:MAG: methyltransferase domain-containing protein [Candidatus Eremiobacteraeota bacterium]|nr:methyltransferase domain-containing protein [Candidatus Eremiobacteraeota bacterium]MCW5867086.1 methyltransferase domain-containing protein [Candidatus Eremiobacteraeota bacterium]